ncbi:hypothetical protein BOX15_Mlig002813g1, partial [Macrostomum lignano]
SQPAFRQPSVGVKGASKRNEKMLRFCRLHRIQCTAAVLLLTLLSLLSFFFWSETEIAVNTAESNIQLQPQRHLKPASQIKDRPAGPPRISFGTKYFGDNSGWKDYTTRWRENGQRSCGFDCDIVPDPAIADAVLFHGRDLPSKPPKLQRKYWQYWVYMNMESPLSTKSYGYDVSSAPAYRFLFNWTATTMLESSVHMPYGMWSLRDKPVEGPFYSPQKKRYMAYIAFSNCKYSYNGRAEKIAELKRYIDVHVYGKCGDRALPKDWNVWRKISEEYRFYLSFENAFCRDYITEKFHNNGLDSQAVPVAFGGLSRSDYERVSPPGSFVYALDFPSMRQLAEHLKQLAADEAQYASYHEWKKRYEISPRSDLLCGTCARLHKDRSVGVFDLSRFYDIKRNCRPSYYKYLV